MKVGPDAGDRPVRQSPAAASADTKPSSLAGRQLADRILVRKQEGLIDTSDEALQVLHSFDRLGGTGVILQVQLDHDRPAARKRLRWMGIGVVWELSTRGRCQHSGDKWIKVRASTARRGGKGPFLFLERVAARIVHTLFTVLVTRNVEPFAFLGVSERFQAALR